MWGYLRRFQATLAPAAALHLTGCWYLWLIFAQSYLGRVDPSAAQPEALYTVLAAMAVAVPLLRTWAWARRRTHKRAPAAETATP